MPATTDQIRNDLIALRPSERAELAHFLIQSLDKESSNTGDEQEVARAWDAELERRAVEIRTGAAEGQPAEQVFAELRSKYTRASPTA